MKSELRRTNPGPVPRATKNTDDRTHSASERGDAAVASRPHPVGSDGRSGRLRAGDRSNDRGVDPAAGLVGGGAVASWIGTVALLAGAGPQVTAVLAMVCGFLVPITVAATSWR